MPLAMQQMSAGWQAAFFTAAVVLFVLAAAKNVAVPALKNKVDLVALGLAAFVFVFAWNAYAVNS